MNQSDQFLIDGLNYLKDEIGVSFTKIAELMDCSLTALSQLKSGKTDVFGFAKKQKLRKIIDNYKKIEN
jgi:predicted transcriptional regulator